MIHEAAAQALADKRHDRMNDLRQRTGMTPREKPEKPTQMDYEDAEVVINTIKKWEKLGNI